MKEFIKRKVPTRRIKIYLKYIFSKKTDKYSFIQRDTKKIVVALAADYSNLGDVAITYSQEKYLKEIYPDYEIIDFPISHTIKDLKSLKKIITSQDIITIVGGGNTGDMYMDTEIYRQLIISEFINNKIISFPQTIDFSDTEIGRRELKKAIEIYSKHKNLTLCAREEKSYKMYTNLFVNNKVLYVPDIVLILNKEYPKYERKNILLCLRGDKEKNISEKEQVNFIKKLEEKYIVTYDDTCIEKNRMSINERNDELEKIWTKFKKSKLVITDRLHGMIFCVITKTPCIAFDNSNKKVSGVYNAWLKNCKYIKMIEKNNFVEAFEFTQKLYDEKQEYEMLNLKDKFKELL